MIVVTDRRDLQRQLSVTAALTGDNVEIANSAAAVKTIAKRMGPGLVFATIQKYRDLDQVGDAPLTAKDLPKSSVVIAESPSGVYRAGEDRHEVLNISENILVLVDEAHRTQGGDLQANLLAGLPNCARIGFTGTPIIMGEKRRTHEIFGAFIDRYTIKQSEADGATVPVLYEGRTAKGALRDGASLDELFEDLFRTHTRDELEAIKKKYATKGHIFDAPALIAEKARDILRHYVTHILPNGYKAQVVAYSRLAAIRYFDAFHVARKELLAEAAALNPEDKAIDDEALCQRPPAVQARVMAWRNRDLLAHLEFAPIVSGSTNDDPAWAVWTDHHDQEQKIKRFKKPLIHAQAEKSDPLAMLVVKSMLLTGFDAPIAGVMYLDRPIREAELLQAIARVNRTGFGKQCGIVVDYYGVAQHLREALKAYANEDIEGALASLRDEIPILRDRHLRVIDLFRQRGIVNLDDAEECVHALANEKLRAEFAVKLKAFLSLLDVVLPRPEGLPFSRDAKKLAYIYARARNRYKDSPILGKDIGAKVRKLIDDHVISLGIDPKIPPIQLTDADFAKHLGRQPNDRAKASEMEHAIRAHIRQHLDEDPVKYRKLSERLNDLLKAVDTEWDAVVSQLQGMIDELQQADSKRSGNAASDSAIYSPFMRTVFDALAETITTHPVREAGIATLTRSIVDMFVAEANANPNLWKPNKIPDQEDLKARVFEKLTLSRLVPFESVNALADALVSQARANHSMLGAQ